MKVKNISKHRYCHARLDEKYSLQMLILKPNEVQDVPDEVAKNWLKTGEVIEFVEPKEAKKLVDENAALKKELEKLKQQKDCAECYADDKTPAQADCDKCNEVKAKKPSKKATTKKSTKKNK